MLRKLRDFLFGKAPNIFDPDGTIRHNLPRERWDAWGNRYLKGEDYNWRHHKGKQPLNANPNHSSAK